jgi:hypothetical protein
MTASRGRPCRRSVMRTSSSAMHRLSCARARAFGSERGIARMSSVTASTLSPAVVHPSTRVTTSPSRMAPVRAAIPPGTTVPTYTSPPS